MQALCAAAPLLLLPVGAIAAPERLDCSLTDVETKAGSTFDRLVGAENRSISLVFDEQARTLTVIKDGSSRALNNITITQTSMSGAVDEISLGVDRSSWSIVLQSYELGSMRAEFGACRLSGDPPPSR